MIFERGYSTSLGFECLISCITNYFNYFNIPIRGSDILFYYNVSNVYYDPTNNPYLFLDYRKKIFSILDTMMIRYENCYHTNMNMAKESLFYLVEIERPITIKVSSKYLTHNTIFKKTRNSTHFINIIGKYQNLLYISDGYIPTGIPTFFEGFVDQNQIFSAWENAGFQYIQYNFNNATINHRQIETVILENTKYFSNYCKSGKSALLESLKYIEINVKQPEVAGNLIINLNYQIKVYGYFAYKRYILEYINLHCQDNLYLINEYNEILDEWNKISLFLIKFGLSKKYGDFRLVINKFTDILDKEEGCINKIIKTISEN